MIVKNPAVISALALVVAFATVAACSSSSTSTPAEDGGGDSAGATGPDASTPDGTVSGDVDAGAAADASIADVDAAPVPIGTIVVAPTTASVPAGYSQPYLATLMLNDGGKIDVTTLVNWSTGDAGAATITNAGADKGLAKAVALGTTTIVAADPGGTAVGATASIVVNGATLTNLLVSPSPGNVMVGKTLQFNATGTFSDATARRVTKDVNWTTGDGTLATIDANGLATGVKAGTTFSTASNATMSAIDSATLIVQ